MGHGPALGNGKAATTRRIRRELRTLNVMIEIYCGDHHGRSRGLCPECKDLWEFAKKRVERCPFGTDKPTCLNCTVHCFKPEMRERIREVMRFAGPRMPLRHPLLSIYHVVEGRKPPPEKPAGKRGVN